VIGPDFADALASAQSGDQAGFEVLYRNLNPRLLRYLFARAPGEAEDLASETWLAASRQIADFVGDEAGFRAWLFTIAHRRVVQHWRDRGRRPVISGDHLAEVSGADDTEASALDVATGAQAARTIARLLSPDQADVVLLRILADLDVATEASILGKRPGTVRVLQHNALRHLAKKLSTEALTQ